MCKLRFPDTNLEVRLRWSCLAHKKVYFVNVAKKLLLTKLTNVRTFNELFMCLVLFCILKKSNKNYLCGCKIKQNMKIQLHKILLDFQNLIILSRFADLHLHLKKHFVQFLNRKLVPNSQPSAYLGLLLKQSMASDDKPISHCTLTIHHLLFILTTVNPKKIK